MNDEGPIGCLQMLDEEDCTLPGFQLYGSVELKGRTYGFMFGHKKRKDVDLGVLRKVLKSFKAR